MIVNEKSAKSDRKQPVMSIETQIAPDISASSNGPVRGAAEPSSSEARGKNDRQRKEREVRSETTRDEYRDADCSGHLRLFQRARTRRRRAVVFRGAWQE